MSTAMTVIPAGAVESRAFMPVFDITAAIERRDALVMFTKKIMHEGTDYGKVPGSAKDCLLKPGAEKLCTFFGLISEMVIVHQVEDWTGADHRGEPFFYYHYKCKLFRHGQLMGEGEGSCNSWESKYRYRWVSEDYLAVNDVCKDGLLKRGGSVFEFDFSVDKGETGGKYGKPAEYWESFRTAISEGSARRAERETKTGKKLQGWEIDAVQYRVPNPDIADQVNTILKMAHKRALVAGVLITVNASEYYSQDLEDLEPMGAPPQIQENSREAQQRVLDRKLAEAQTEGYAPNQPRELNKAEAEAALAELGNKFYAIGQQEIYRHLTLERPSTLGAAKALVRKLEAMLAELEQVPA